MKITTSLIRSFACIAVVVALTGCATHSTSSNSSSSNEPAANASSDGGGIVGTIPPDSKFAKISIGMSMKEVYDTIGQPTDTHSYTTGKAFIPFYFGNDVARSEALYKGEGRITFTGAGIGGVALKVFRIEYDPKETGYTK